MKPRLRYSRGTWSCAAADWQCTRIVGYGWNPQDAYTDWVVLGGQPVFHGKHIHG